MSNIYVQEPPALGKVVLKTSVGEIDLELWTKEAPRACRNFIQLCMEGYYDGTVFHRVVADFIVQGGDPNGDGTGGESVYGEPFKDEFHTRLRFNRRGLVAMANAGKDDNGSQFFFTLNATPELQNKHTIFGKVTGETVFNMLKLAEGEVDHNDRPLYPHKIVSAQILINPFEDIVPRVAEKPAEPELASKTKQKGVKNFGLLSFGMEAEEEEEEDESSEFRGKPKSTHDLLDDPKLSKISVAELDDDVSDEDPVAESEKTTESNIASIRDKLNAKRKINQEEAKTSDPAPEEKADEEEYYIGKDKIDARKKQAEEIREEIKKLRKEMSTKKVQIQPEETEEKPTAKPTNELIKSYEDEQEKYKKKLETIPKKGTSREQFTLSLLNKFKEKLNTAKQKCDDEGNADNSSKIDDDDDNENWLTHKLHFEDKGEVLAKDANTKDDNWYDLYDPRNPLNKRKREKGQEGQPKKRHK